MRKWMRQRLQRRKKTPQESSDQPAPPPLQPAYFEAEQKPDKPPRETPRENVASDAPPKDQEEQQQQSLSDEMALDQSAALPTSARSSGSTGRGRRRRGGRGRGGRGREQAVAQAFTPAAVKGSASLVVGEPEKEGLSETGEADSEIAATTPRANIPRTSVPKTPAAVPAATQRPPKGIVVLAIGLPGSGKSSWFKRHNVAPLSSDVVRSLLFDDVREQRFQDLVFSNLRSMLKARLIAKRPTNYVDATNLTPQERQHWIKLARDYQYEVHAVFFDVPLEVCIERHQRRERVIPEDVMHRMAAKLKAPAFEEGFAKITVVRVKKKEG